MPNWFRDTKDGDKIALLLLFVGIGLLMAGTGVILFVIFYMKDETRLDRAIIAVSAVSAQGNGLVTAAMGVLRFQSKTTGSSQEPQPATTSSGDISKK